MAKMPPQKNLTDPASLVKPEIPAEGSEFDPITAPIPRSDEILRALDLSFLDQFRQLLTGIILLVAVLLFGEALKLARGNLNFVPTLSVSLVMLLGLRFALRTWSPGRLWLHPLGVGVAILITANGLYFVLIQRDVPPSVIPLAFVLVLIGSLFLSVQWYLLTTVFILCTWVILTYQRIPDGRLDEFASGVVMFLFLSLLLFFYRVRTQTNLARLRLQDHGIQEKLKAALSSARTDLLERRKSENALKESEERYRSLIDLSPAAIVIHDGRTIHFANLAAARIAGVSTPEECIGVKLRDLVDPEYHEELKERVVRMLERNETVPHTDLRFKGLDGVSRVVDSAGQKVMFGGQPAVQSVFQDVTERRASERALRDSEERYRLLAENVSDGIWTSDLDLNFDYFSPAVSRILGAPTGEALKIPLSRMLTPDSLRLASRGLGEEMKKAAELGRDYVSSRTIELEMIRADGRTTWVEVTARILMDNDGKPNRILGVTREINERKAAEAELRRREEQYRLLAENVTDVIWTSDLDLKFTYFSPSVERTFGITVNQALLLPVEVMMTRESAAACRQAVKDAIGKKGEFADDIGEWCHELELRDSKGGKVWVEVKSRILRGASGHPNGFLGVARDITERRQAEEHLRKSEERYRLLAENATDVIFTCDKELRTTFLSPAVERMFGISADELLGRKPEHYLAPDSLRVAMAAIQEEMAKSSAQGSNSYSYSSRTLELEYRKRDGGTVWTEVRFSPLRDSTGNPTGLVGVIRDIEDRRRADQEKRYLEAQLVQAQKLEAIGTLAGGIAHDFNNLLGGILGYAELLKLDATEGDEVYKSAEIIESAASRARELTGQLLGFARKGKHQNTEVNLDHTVKEVTSLLGRTLNKNVRIREELHSDGQVVMGDPAQMHQVLMNLALNANDAMTDGGQLEFRTEAIEADVAFLRAHAGAEHHAYVCVSVSDTGDGIPREIRDRVFEPFFSTKEPGKGTGMGLAMVYGIVKNHGGFVDLVSEVGKGSSFRIYFPAKQSAKLEGPSQEQNGLVRGTGKVLVVDDEPVVRAMAGDFLRYLGYEVHTVANGEEAVEYYRSPGSSVNLVLVDMIMPKMGGRDCLRALKKIDPDVRVVLTTGYGQDSAAQQIIDEGARGFIQKPYEISRFSEVIARAMKS